MFQLVLIVFLTLLVISMIYPFMYELTISLHLLPGSLRPGSRLALGELTLEAYRHILESDHIWVAAYNSIFRTIVGTALMLLIMTTAAYALSKKQLPHRKTFTLYIVITMFFSGGMLPSYLLVKGMGLFDTKWALIVPVLMNTYWMILIRNYFMSLSDELEESAKMDGANDIRILFAVIIPLSKPVLASIALFCAVFHWNAWFDAIMYTQDNSMTILQVLLRRLIITGDELNIQLMLAGARSSTPESLNAAILVVVTAPILILYPLLQKFYSKGIVAGYVKD